MAQTTLIQGDNRHVLAGFPGNHFHAIVTDPPYGIRFMSKKWDYNVPGVEFWKHALRVLRPGGYLLCFAGARTYHRMAVNIEDAGFEIRDQIMWVYGSGFPKSLDVGKAVDKTLGAERKVVETKKTPSGGFANVNKVNKREGYRPENYNAHGNVFEQTKPATPEAEQWQGWGTALKPAHEPVVVARKPLSEKNVAKNVLRWGTGAVNIDACRVAHPSDADRQISENKNRHADFNSHNGVRVQTKGIYHGDNRKNVNYNAAKGRYPANLIHDGSTSVLKLFPVTKSGAVKNEKQGYKGVSNTSFLRGKSTNYNQHGDSGSAARFFYFAKASTKERNAGLQGVEHKRDTDRENDSTALADKLHNKGKTHNHHPTVKPVSLMRYLVRLVTPPGGHVLDPFAGTFTTGIACLQEGFNCTGIEYEPDYHQIGLKRIEYYKSCQQ